MPTTPALMSGGRCPAADMTATWSSLRTVLLQSRECPLNESNCAEQCSKSDLNNSWGKSRDITLPSTSTTRRLYTRCFRRNPMGSTHLPRYVSEKFKMAQDQKIGPRPQSNKILQIALHEERSPTRSISTANGRKVLIFSSYRNLSGQ